MINPYCILLNLACLFHVNSWVKENKLDQLEFARQKLAYCYLSTAATLFAPEMSDARMSWAKNSVLTTVVDDFFDVGGSRDELLNIITLVEKYDLVSCADFLLPCWLTSMIYVSL